MGQKRFSVIVLPAMVEIQMNKKTRERGIRSRKMCGKIEF